MTEYPEHDKLHAIKHESQAVGAFLEWIRDKGIEFCLFDDRIEEYVPFRDSVEKILASYFEIDRTALENEKLAMIEACRRENERVRKKQV